MSVINFTCNVHFTKGNLINLLVNTQYLSLDLDDLGIWFDIAGLESVIIAEIINIQFAAIPKIWTFNYQLSGRIITLSQCISVTF